MALEGYKIGFINMWSNCFIFYLETKLDHRSLKLLSQTCYNTPPGSLEQKIKRFWATSWIGSGFHEDREPCSTKGRKSWDLDITQNSKERTKDQLVPLWVVTYQLRWTFLFLKVKAQWTQASPGTVCITSTHTPHCARTFTQAFVTWQAPDRGNHSAP